MDRCMHGPGCSLSAPAMLRWQRQRRCRAERWHQGPPGGGGVSSNRRKYKPQTIHAHVLYHFAYQDGNYQLVHHHVQMQCNIWCARQPPCMWQLDCYSSDSFLTERDTHWRLCRYHVIRRTLVLYTLCNALLLNPGSEGMDNGWGMDGDGCCNIPAARPHCH